MIMSLPFSVLVDIKGNKESAFIASANESINSVEKSLNYLRKNIEFVISFYNASGFVDRDEFEIFTHDVLDNNNLIISWAPVIKNSEPDITQFKDLILFMNRDFELTKLNIIDFDNDVYANLYPITYVSREAANYAMLGQNLSENTVLLNSINKSFQGDTSVIAPISNGNGDLFIVYPVYKAELSESRQIIPKTKKGVIFSILKTREVFKGIFKEYKNLLLEVNLIGDVNEDYSKLSIFSSGVFENKPNRANNSLLYRDLKFIKKISFFNRDIEVVVYPNPENTNSMDYGQFYTILFLSVLVFLLSLKFFLAEMSKKKVLEEKEKALSNANIELEGRVDELMHARSELEKSYQEVQEAKYEAEEANRFNKEFLANMSHELRTPMHAIINYSDMGVRKIESADRNKLEKYFSNINKSGCRLLKIINNLLDLSKLEAKAVILDADISDLNEVVVDVLNEVYSLIEQKKIKVTLDIKSKDTQAVFDYEKIVQVVMNLISNSIKFSGSKSKINIEINDAIIDVASDKYSGISLSVSDSGPGIPEGELNNIFDKFIQSSVTQTGAGGTGLGLPICREIIDAHKGLIWASNNESEGAKFTFILPKDFLG